jgi:hypothetical protein
VAVLFAGVVLIMLGALYGLKSLAGDGRSGVIEGGVKLSQAKTSRLCQLLLLL